MLLKDIAIRNLNPGIPVHSNVTGRRGRIAKIILKDEWPQKPRYDRIEISWYDTSPDTVVFHKEADTIETVEYLEY